MTLYGGSLMFYVTFYSRCLVLNKLIPDEIRNLDTPRPSLHMYSAVAVLDFEKGGGALM